MTSYRMGLMTSQALIVMFVLVVGASDVLLMRKPRSDVKRVHVVSMNHLDVGYANFINNILNDYFHVYFPRVAALGSELRDRGFTETFIYTTHPWLIWLYLNCPPNLVLSGVRLLCPHDKDVALLQSAIKAGYITWHAGPMNLQFEYSPEWLIESSLDISKELDRRFNITRSMRVLSQRDIPGMSHAVLPSLVRSGIEAISVGVNSMSAPPDVPQLFRWRYGSRDEVMATWHPGGYPDNPGPDPAHPGGISRKDCVVSADVPDVLCFAFRTDNSGPPENIAEILSYYEILRAEFPGAEIQASTLEDYFSQIRPIRDRLPLVTKEIGDTWSVGFASDPRKNVEFRTVARLLGDCIKNGECKTSDPRIYNATRLLVKLPEHTWGLWTTADYIHWRNDQFNPQADKPNFKKCVMSWAEQRNITYLVIDSLQGHPVMRRITRALDELRPAEPSLTGYSEVPIKGLVCSGSNIKRLSIAPDGSIRELNVNGVNVVDGGDDRTYLSRFMYVTYNETDFDRLGDAYNYIPAVSTGFIKPNVTLYAHPESREWRYVMTAAFKRNGPDCDLWIRIEPENMTSHVYYGAPERVWIHYEETKIKSASLNVEVILVNKTTTRLPESLYLAFTPHTRGQKWRYSKLGHMIDPLNVMLNGSQYQHGIDDGGIITSTQEGGLVHFLSPDVPLACPMTKQMTYPTSFPAPLQPITDELTGVAFNLFNNIWDTNFIFWYPYFAEDKNFKARFQMQFNV